MLLTPFFSSPPQQQYYTPYTPPRSSPLAERSVNVVPRLFDFSMASPSESKKPQRAYKPNPVMQTRDQATKRRRDVYLNRVQNGRHDKQWEARVEQIHQLDFVSERKRWEAAKARQAPLEDDDMIEEAIEDAPLPQWTNDASPQAQEMTEADYVAAQEEYELQQLIASMEQDDAASQHFGSDDEDYDELFMVCATTVDQRHQQQYQQQQQQQQPQQSRRMAEETHDMDMDMTDG